MKITERKATTATAAAAAASKRVLFDQAASLKSTKVDSYRYSTLGSRLTTATSALQIKQNFFSLLFYSTCTLTV